MKKVSLFHKCVTFVGTLILNRIPRFTDYKVYVSLYRFSSMTKRDTKTNQIMQFRTFGLAYSHELGPNWSVIKSF